MFTSYDTLNSILAHTSMKGWMKFLLYPGNLEMFSPDLRDMPIGQAAFQGETPWNTNLKGVSEQIVDTANLVLEIESGRRDCLQLSHFGNYIPGEETSLDDPEARFMITSDINLKSDRKRPCVLILPGGGYEHVSFQNEGTPLQWLFERNGYAAFTLRYRVGSARYPKPQEDVITALKFIYENADKWGIDKENIGLMGFSAGGHLAASVAGLYKELGYDHKPAFVLLGYPVITFKKDVTHEGSVQFLLGEKADTMREKLSVENMITGDYPPTFAWANLDDDCVPPENTKLLEAALEKAGVKHKCVYYPKGGHGCGLAYDNSAWEWSTEMFRFLALSFVINLHK